MAYKPENYNSVSPYLVVDGAQEYMELIRDIFEGELLSRYDRPDGRIVHAEMRIDDSVLMFSNSSDDYPPNQLLIHLYVPDVDRTFQRAIDRGCVSLGEPKENPGDPDRRGNFRDPAGHFWSVSTQVEEE